MLSVELPAEIENHFRDVVEKEYHGNMQEAFVSLLRLHEKYGWKQQLREDVGAIREEVRQRGGITSGTIDDAISRYRKSKGISNG
jgi:hypothetical protein